MHGHVLHRELELNGQTPKLDDLRQADANGNRPDVLRGRSPVRQDITRIPDAPALAEKDRRDGLQVHLVGIGPAMLAADGPPLLGKHADEELLGQITCHYTWPKLPFSLAREMRGRGREDCRRSCTEDPVARVRRRKQLQQGQIAQPGVPRELAGGRLVGNDVVDITGRVIRFKSLVRLTGITGWKFQLLFHWPLFNSKLLN